MEMISPTETVVPAFRLPFYYPEGRLPMTSRNRVFQTLFHEQVDRLPRSFAIAPSTQKKDWERCEDLYERYPSDIMLIDGRKQVRGYNNISNKSLGLPPNGDFRLASLKAAAEARSSAQSSSAGSASASVGKKADSSQNKPAPKATVRVSSSRTRLAEIRKGLLQKKDEPEETSQTSVFQQQDSESVFEQPGNDLLRWSDEPQFIRVINDACRDTQKFTLGLVDFSPWEELKQLLNEDCTEDYDDLLDRFVRQVWPWLKTDVDAICLTDWVSTDDTVDSEAAKNRNDLLPFYQKFVELAHARDKFAFFDFGGHVLEYVSMLLKIKADALSCMLTPEIACQLSDYTASFNALSEDPNGKRLTFWAHLPDDVMDRADKCEIDQMVMENLEELNMGNRGVIANGHWNARRTWHSVGYALNAWERGIPEPEPDPQLSDVTSSEAPQSNTPRSPFQMEQNKY